MLKKIIKFYHIPKLKITNNKSAPAVSVSSKATSTCMTNDARIPVHRLAKDISMARDALHIIIWWIIYPQYKRCSGWIEDVQNYNSFYRRRSWTRKTCILICIGYNNIGQRRKKKKKRIFVFVWLLLYGRNSKWQYKRSFSKINRTMNCRALDT